MAVAALEPFKAAAVSGQESAQRGTASGALGDDKCRDGLRRNLNNRGKVRAIQKKANHRSSLTPPAFCASICRFTAECTSD
jgi:hypothetical protein